MKSVGLIVSLLGLASAFAGRGQDSVAPISFTRLPKGEHLKIVLDSQGCFHHHRYEFQFGRLPVSTITVTKQVTRWVGDEPVGRDMVYQGVVKLTENDLKGLDRLLAFYRSKPGDGCTTVDRIDVIEMRGSKAIAWESYVDGSCQEDADHYLHPELDRFLSFDEVLKRLENPK